MINSRQKGAQFEREVAKSFTAEGFPAKRGAQVTQGQWGLSAPDVIVPCLPDIHVECKRHGRARFDLDAAIAQAEADGGPGKLAIVVHRKDNCRKLVTATFEDFCLLLRESSFVASQAHNTTQANTHK